MDQRTKSPARIAPLLAETSPELREQFESMKKNLGFVPNSILIMQRTPKLAKALAALTAKQRLAITLRWQRHLTNAEVAQVMGVSVTAVELLFSRAMKALKVQLGGMVK